MTKKDCNVKRLPLITPAITAAALGLSACATGGVVETRATKNGEALILSADNRAILFSPPHDGGKGNLRCAEPQPDVARAIAQEFAALAKASVPIGGTQTDAGANIAAASREAIGELGRRTPTIQLMRDTLYRACEAVMNGVIKPGDPLVGVVVTQLDNILLGMHAIDGLTGMGAVGKVTISAQSSAPAKSASSGDGDSAETSASTLTATVSGDEAALDKATAAEISKAVVEIVKQALDSKRRDRLAAAAAGAI